MGLKIKRLFLAVYYTICNALGKLLARKKKKVWLISERGFDARDNGYHLYKWVFVNHPEIDVYYVIGGSDTDRWKIKGKTVKKGSLKHFILLYEADALISTHAFGWSPDMVVYNRLYKAGLFKPKGTTVFLQHGVNDKDEEFLHRENFAPDLFVTSTKNETDNIIHKFEQPEDVVAPTGLCRFDNLNNSKVDESLFLFMPTWRLWLQYANEHEFVSSDYFIHINNILKSEELNQLLKKYNKKLLFYPHIEMQKYIDKFEAGERVVILDASKADVQDLLKRSSILITDYSSVYFDFIYMRKPVVFYQWDKERYAKEHYQGFIEKHEDYGEVVNNPGRLVEAIEKSINSPNQLCKDPFIYHDKEHCKRVFERIEAKTR